MSLSYILHSYPITTQISSTIAQLLLPPPPTYNERVPLRPHTGEGATFTPPTFTPFHDNITPTNFPSHRGYLRFQLVVPAILKKRKGHFQSGLHFNFNFNHFPKKSRLCPQKGNNGSWNYSERYFQSFWLKTFSFLKNNSIHLTIFFTHQSCTGAGRLLSMQIVSGNLFQNTENTRIYCTPFLEVTSRCHLEPGRLKSIIVTWAEWICVSVLYSLFCPV